MRRIGCQRPNVYSSSRGKENTNAEQISARLLAGEFNGLPVVDNNGTVVGIVTAIDVLKALQESGQNSNKQLNSMMAKDIMTPNPSVVKKGVKRYNQYYGSKAN